MNSMFRSATFKLTVYYLMIITAISVIFSSVVYRIGTDDLAFGLHRQTERLTTDFPVFTGSPYLKADRDLREGDRHLIVRLVVFNVLVIGLAGFASYALARRSLRPIETAHERQRRFTANVSHELRTPLTALQMESEVMLLDKAASKNDLRATLASNVEEAGKLTNLIRNLLDLSQLDGGDKMLSSTIISLDQAVMLAVKQTTALAHGQAITINWSSEQSVLVQANLDAMTQLIIILLDNAIKYSPSGSQIIVSLTATDGQAKLSIRDHGQGISKTDLEHVFERFYRADSARTGGQKSGYGLGLSIAQQLAAAQQATISLTSQVGKGTTANVLLPLASEAKQTSKPATDQSLS